MTSIGIHERSSREKISHVMNGAAHIMNDEATRKYLQAIKRMGTFLQRAYPTDPSRSVDFNGFRDAGLGARGAGSDKTVSLLVCCMAAALCCSLAAICCAPVVVCTVPSVVLLRCCCGLLHGCHVLLYYCCALLKHLLTNSKHQS